MLTWVGYRAASTLKSLQIKNYKRKKSVTCTPLLGERPQRRWINQNKAKALQLKWKQGQTSLYWQSTLQRMHNYSSVPFILGRFLSHQEGCMTIIHNRWRVWRREGTESSQQRMNHLLNILPLHYFIGKCNLPRSQNSSTKHIYTNGKELHPASSLANGTITIQGNILQTQQAQIHRKQSAEMGGYCLIMHIRKQLTNSKKGNKIFMFSTDDTGTIL